MSPITRAPFPLLVLVLGACGGATSQAATHDEHAHGHERPRVAEVDALHDVLAPVFHSEPGPTRAAAACQNAAVLHDRSAAAQAASPPAGVDGSHWQDETSELVHAADALVAECSVSGPAAEQRLADLHARFHGVMELAYGPESHDHHDGDRDADRHDGDRHDDDHHDGH